MTIGKQGNTYYDLFAGLELAIGKSYHTFSATISHGKLTLRRSLTGGYTICVALVPDKPPAIGIRENLDTDKKF